MLNSSAVSQPDFPERLTQLRRLGFQSARPEQALLQLLKDPPPHTTSRHYQQWLTLRAQLSMSVGDYPQALSCFITLGDAYQAGYCELLLGNGDQAAEHWEALVSRRTNHWCLTLLSLITGQIHAFYRNSGPTMIQIRNHLEMDLAHLLRARQGLMVDNLLACGDWLAEIHPESYKYLGRALLQAGDPDRAENYLLQGQKLLPHDPEVYFHLAQIMAQRGEMRSVHSLLGQCLLIYPNHWPAEQLLKTLEG